jgi:hypothetical protein
METSTYDLVSDDVVDDESQSTFLYFYSLNIN